MPYRCCKNCGKKVPMSPGTPTSHRYSDRDDFYCDDCKDENSKSKPSDGECVIC